MPAENKYLKITALMVFVVLISGLTAASLQIEFKDSQKNQAFINSPFSLNFDVFASSTSTDASDLKNPEFEARFLGTDLKVSGNLDNCNSVKGRDIITPDLTPGIYTLELEVNCEYQNGSEITGTEQMKVNVNESRRAQVSQSPAGDLSLKQVEENGLEFNVEYWEGYDKLRPQAESFRLNVYEDDRKIDSGNWFTGVRKEDSVELSLQSQRLPELETGDYTFELALKTDDMNEEFSLKKIDVSKNLEFAGKVKAPSGGGVKTGFEFGPYSFETEKDGSYSKRVKPGTYDMTLDFPNTDVQLKGVEIKKGYKGDITYDYYSLDQDLNVTGLDAVNLVGIAFGYPMQDASISTNYDFGKINWRELEVFECKNWNLGKGCHSDWKVLDSEKVDITPWSGEASFPVQATEFDGGNSSQKILLNSYVIGRNQPMDLDDFKVESSEAYLNQEFKAEGTVRTGSGRPVENADVEIQISGKPGDKTFQTTTDGNGDFSTELVVPKVGDYSLKVSVKKPPYSPIQKSAADSIKVVKEKSISLNAPKSFEIGAETQDNMDVTLKNTGQVSVTDIDLSISSDVEASVAGDNMFDSLDPGEAEDVGINVTAPEQEAGSDYPSLDLTVKGSSGGEKVEDSSSTTVVVSEPEESEASTKEKDSSSSFSLPDTTNNITGDFLQGTSINHVLAGILVMVLLAAVIVKKKSSGGRSPRRNVVEGL